MKRDRQVQPVMDATRRWDRAYRLILGWSTSNSRTALTEAGVPSPPVQEVSYDDSSVCARLDRAAGADPDHRRSHPAHLRRRAPGGEAPAAQGPDPGQGAGEPGPRSINQRSLTLEPVNRRGTNCTDFARMRGGVRGKFQQITGISASARLSPWHEFRPCFPQHWPIDTAPETWPSGRRHTPAKGADGKPSRGFESLRLRQITSQVVALHR